MIEQPPQNIWEYPADIICITTNGTIRKDGACVMGRGIALQAKTRFPGIENDIGKLLRSKGNHVFYLEPSKKGICTFPVKHNWWEQADLELISRSAKELARMAAARPFRIYAIPHPGCQNGGKTWGEVRPLLVDILPDNIHIVDLGIGVNEEMDGARRKTE